MPKKKQSDPEKAKQAADITERLYRVFKRAALRKGVKRIDRKAEDRFREKFQLSIEYALEKSEWRPKDEKWIKFLTKLAGELAWGQATARRTDTITRKNMFDALLHVKAHCCPLEVLGRWCSFIGPDTSGTGKVRRRSPKR